MILTLLTNPYTIIAGLIIIIVALFLSKKLTLSIGPLKLGFIKNNFQAKILNIIDLTRKYTIDIESARTNILRNQMNHFEMVFGEVCTIVDGDRHMYDAAKLKTKMKLKENGIGNLDAVHFSSYVGDAIDEMRHIFNSHKEHKYFNSPQFADNIGRAWNHALATYKFWTDETQRLKTTMNNELKEIND